MKEALIAVIPWPSSFHDAVCQGYDFRSHTNAKVPSVHQIKQISTENFDLTLVYTVSQLTLSMDSFDGLRDRYDALVGAFRREDKKEIDRLEAENLKDIGLN